jgi:hypothetical protein
MRIISRRAKIEPKSTKIEAQPVVAEPSNREKYEYQTCIMDADADLAQWGENGWVCYAVIPRFPNDPSSKKAVFYFRRQK